MKILVTGGKGFIGSNFILQCLKKQKDVKIVNLDNLTVGSNLMNLSELKNNNYSFVRGNICNKILVNKLLKNVDIVVNFAAESHVDRSIKDSDIFIKSNFVGVHNILENIRLQKNIKLLHISTDEVYGEINKGRSRENDVLNPSNPYSATKASAEMLIKSYIRTYDLDVIITRASNNFGPRQYPEKLIPKTILNALNNKPIPIHGTGESIRQWIYVEDNCDALLKIVSNWKKSYSIFNVGGNEMHSTLSVVKKILKIMKKSQKLITHIEDRPGQDKRYAVDSNLILKELNFKPKTDFEKGLKLTIEWYLKNIEWWQNISLKKASNPTPWI
jgi:dTDP-glucose 4,6-dehydratase